MGPSLAGPSAHNTPGTELTLNEAPKSDTVEESCHSTGRRAMLTLTENASTIVRDITTQPGLPESAGLRITSDGDQSSFAISAAEQPEPADQVVEQAGATLYLDEDAAVMLDDKILDAAVDDTGKVEFALAHQP